MLNSQSSLKEKYEIVKSMQVIQVTDLNKIMATECCTLVMFHFTGMNHEKTPIITRLP
jgi:hypothetical protein